jgi:hypothetical protein
METLNGLARLPPPDEPTNVDQRQKQYSCVEGKSGREPSIKIDVVRLLSQMQTAEELRNEACADEVLRYLNDSLRTNSIVH